MLNNNDSLLRFFFLSNVQLHNWAVFDHNTDIENRELQYEDTYGSSLQDKIIKVQTKCVRHFMIRHTQVAKLEGKAPMAFGTVSVVTWYQESVVSHSSY